MALWWKLTLIPSPSPQREGSQISCPLSFWERARVRADFAVHPFIQQRHFKQTELTALDIALF